MTEDLRCCGTGTCIINAEGYCWCGQRWDGLKMSFPGLEAQTTALPSSKARAPQTTQQPVDVESNSK